MKTNLLFILLSILNLTSQIYTQTEKSPEDFLIHGVYNQNVDEVSFALSNGADANANIFGNPALFIAAQQGDTTIVSMLLKAGAKINAKTSISQRTALHEAVLKSQVNVVVLLLKNGANVNAQNKFGRTPLYYAKNPPIPLNLPNESKKIIKILASYGGKQ